MARKIDSQVKKSVRELYSNNDDAKRFLEWCAGMQRDARETKIDHIIKVAGISRASAVALAKELESAGCGRFIYGRRGHSSRFSWKFSRISLGQIALGESEDLDEVSDPLDEDVDESAVSSGLTIAQAKSNLAQNLGVLPEQVEISIKA